MSGLRRDLSLVTTLALPAWSAGPTGDADVLAAAVDAGYEGAQVFLPDQAAAARSLGLVPTAISPARTIADVESLVGMWADGGLESLVLHLGTGFETADEATRLLEATLAAQDRHGVRLLVETHRATLTQDPARTIALVEQFPALRFCADLSHWYTGVEMVYGDWDAKVAALRPVFDRCRMIHGRISDPGCIQVAVADLPAGGDGTGGDATGEAPSYVQHFVQLWGEVARGWAAAEDATGPLPFVIELLPARAHYARTVERDGRREEEVDRWTQADVLWRIARRATASVLVEVPA